MDTLNLAILWHMHQPFYKDIWTGKYAMPWVRLHSIKDYYDMVSILEEFPDVHLTFNLVPSLIYQIEDYTNNNAIDGFMELTLKPASDLTEDEKIEILQNFFMANWNTMIKIHPRYYELLEKRGLYVSKKEIETSIKKFSAQDFLDLQVWFNLAWFDPVFIEKDEFLKSLEKKGKKFTENEKTTLINKQKEIMNLIVPEYKKLNLSGQIELTTTPFYHPILPLVYNTDIAKVSLPNSKPLTPAFSNPDDVKIQIEKAIAFHEQRFGKKPDGMWPSEGSISEDIVPLIVDAGIKWIATDEGILMRSLDISPKKEDILYQPYSFIKDGRKIDIVFRDRVLSDLMGFSYSGWDPQIAVKHFISKLYEIRKRLERVEIPPLVTVILDGENAWEYYRNDGRDFLLLFYSELSKDSSIKTTTISEYLSKYPPRCNLRKLFPGSWINNDFYIWIGHEEDRKAWEYLSKVRNDLVQYQKNQQQELLENIKKAWEQIYIAEGSDWCWWYGDDHFTANDEEFDFLYRQHLMNVYNFIGLDIPEELLIPILSDKITPVLYSPKSFIHPEIDGKITNFYEWSGAGRLESIKAGSSMHRSENIIKEIYFGFDVENLYIRIDLNTGIESSLFHEITFEIRFLEPIPYKIYLKIQQNQVILLGKTNEHWAHIQQHNIIYNLNKILEIKIPFNDLKFKKGNEVMMVVCILKNEEEFERCPARGVVIFTCPSEDFEAIMWQV